MNLIEQKVVKGKKGEPDEVVEIFHVPTSENRLQALVDADTLGEKGKWMRIAILVSTVNEEKANTNIPAKYKGKKSSQGARLDGDSVRAASIRAANILDISGVTARRMEDNYQAAVRMRKKAEREGEGLREAQALLNAMPGDALVVPNLERPLIEGGQNRQHAGYETYDQLVEDLPDGPRRDKLPTNRDKPTTVVNKETEGWDEYVFFEQDHVWIPAEEWQYDFKDVKSLLKKYPDGYYEGEHQFQSKTFSVKGTVPGHSDLARRFTWEQDWDSDDESEFKWTPRPIKTALQIEQELELMWWQLKGLQMEIDMTYVTDPEDFKLGMPFAAGFAEANGMIMEDLLNMLRAGSEGHISYLRKPDESSHVPEGQEPMELERGGDWDDALARLLAQQDQQETPDDADQS